MTVRMSFNSAEANCSGQVRGGHLVSITSDSENAVVYNLTGNSRSFGWIWIGLHVSNNESIFVWTDSINSSYGMWQQENIKINTRKNRDCVKMKSLNIWKLTRCSEKYYYVCETTAHLVPTGATNAGNHTCV